MKVVFKQCGFIIPQYVWGALAFSAVLLSFADFVPSEVVEGSSGRAKMMIAQSGIRLLAEKSSAYFSDTAHQPDSIEDLLSNSRRFPSWKGPYVSEIQRSDPWGTTYIIRSPGVHDVVDVISLGADGLVGGTGTNADIENLPCK